MAKVAREQEELEERIGESEDKRKRTKRALRDALENLTVAESAPGTPAQDIQPPALAPPRVISPLTEQVTSPLRRKGTAIEYVDLSDSDSGDEEFFDAVGAGEVEVVEMPTTEEEKATMPTSVEDIREKKAVAITTSFKGYEQPIREKLKLAADDRPKISLWVSLACKSIYDLTG